MFQQIWKLLLILDPSSTPRWGLYLFEQVRLKKKNPHPLTSVQAGGERRENRSRHIKALLWNTDGDHNEEIETRDELTVK